MRFNEGCYLARLVHGEPPDALDGTYRLLQVRTGEIDVFRVREEDVPELEVSAGFDARRGFEVEYRLETLDTRFDVWGTRSSEVLG